MPAQNVTTAPFMAHPVARQAKQRTEHIMAAILLENFMHMALNVCALGNPSEPEITHQARIGWRRVQSSLKFFKPLLSDFDPAPMAPLKPLIQATDQLRNLDVAIDITLPSWRAALSAQASKVPAHWTGMTRALQAERNSALHEVNTLAHDPQTTRMLLNMAHWIARLPLEPTPKHLAMDPKHLSAWIFKRLHSWHKRLQVSVDTLDLSHQHRLRILAKQQRYAIENVQAWVPHAWAQRFHSRAQKWQEVLGQQRDQTIALALIAQLGPYSDVAQWLQKQCPSPPGCPAQAIGGAGATDLHTHKAYSSEFAQPKHSHRTHDHSG